MIGKRTVRLDSAEDLRRRIAAALVEIEKWQ